MPSLYGLIRKAGHKFAPALIEPYRKLLFKWRDLRHVPAQLHDILEIRRKGFGFHNDYPDSMEKYYGEGFRASDGSIADGVIFMCDGRTLHGGLTDRLRGLLTVYEAAKKSGIPFHIYWTVPFRLEDYLEPAGDMDWRIGENEISYSTADAYPVVVMDKGEPQTYLNNAFRLRAGLSGRRRQVHVYSNSANSKKRYGRLFAELFRPSPMLERELRRHLEVLGAEYCVFTFRFIGLLGDFTDIVETKLTEEARAELIERNLSKLMEMTASLSPGRRVLVTSDSPRFLRAVAERDSRIYIVPGDIQHIDLGGDDNKGAWLKTFVDQFLIMRSREVFRMRTGRMYKSGFPEFAARVGGVRFHDVRF